MPELLTAAEVAALFRVNKTLPYDWHARGELPAIRLPGGRLRWKREDVERLLAQPTDAETGDKGAAA